ncbi:MAG TPA: hypothetical protein VE974_28520 [Thermoanaerobaculia bacterium]|nr:hypothetical protein [Thermoanaerobaculia bacterium]
MRLDEQLRPTHAEAGRRIAALILMLCLMGCSDNAVRLRFGIEAAAKRLEGAPDRAEDRVTYSPSAAPSVPYWMVFFPKRHVVPADLVGRGMPASVADQIFRDLSHVNAGEVTLLVVQQEGRRLTFTKYDGEQTILIEDLIVERRAGPCEVLLRRQGDAVYIVGVL